jgi:hypothetical protein
MLGMPGGETGYRNCEMRCPGLAGEWWMLVMPAGLCCLKGLQKGATRQKLRGLDDLSADFRGGNADVLGQNRAA